MTEQEMLVAMAKRLESQGKARDVGYPTDDWRVLDFDCDYSYPVRFVFDEHGNVVEVGGVV